MLKPIAVNGSHTRPSEVVTWIQEHHVKVLNVAGPRSSRRTTGRAGTPAFLVASGVLPDYGGRYAVAAPDGGGPRSSNPMQKDGR
jgi:hypothetical protein